MRLVGGAQTWNQLVSHPHVAEKSGGISQLHRFPLRGEGSDTYSEPSRRGFQCWEEKFP